MGYFYDLCYLRSGMKFTLIQIKNIIKHDGLGTYREYLLKIQVFFSMLKIPIYLSYIIWAASWENRIFAY